MWRPRSFRFRFTLRTLFVFITVLCLLGGLHAHRASTLHRIEQVLAWHHASVRYGRADRSEGLRGALWLAYEWMAWIVWADRGVASVTIDFDLDPDVLAALRALPHFDTLHIRGLHHIPPAIGTQPAKTEVLLTTLRQGSLLELLAVTRLRILSIDGCVVSDVDLAAISQQRTLSILALRHTHVPEAALADFVRLPRLHRLVVEHSDVTGRELHGVAGSTSLEIATFSETPVGVEFARYIARCPSVVELYVGGKSVNDDFVAELRAHPSIKCLPLVGTSITDYTLDYLAQMPSLAVVHFDDRVTKTGVKEFQRARPEVRVRHPG